MGHCKLAGHARFTPIARAISTLATAAQGVIGRPFSGDDFALVCAALNGDVQGQPEPGIGFFG